MAAQKTIYTNEHKYLVQQLKKARFAAGLNQAEVAKLLGKSQSYVSKCESGQCRIDVVQLKEFARIYKKRLEFFLAK